MRMSALAAGALLGLATAGSAFAGPTQADPYRWCAQYAGRDGSTNCYFITLAQCQAAISGNGGFCRVNTFYTGDQPRPRRH